MSVREGGSYLTRLLQRSRGVSAGAVVPRRKALFEENPGAAAVGQPSRPVQAPGVPEPAPPWPAPNSATDNGRPMRAAVREQPTSPVASSDVPGGQRSATVVQEVPQETLSERQPPRRERGRSRPASPSKGVAPVTAGTRSADPESSTTPPVKPRPVDVTRERPPPATASLPADKVVGEASPTPVPVSVPLQAAHKGMVEDPVAAPRRQERQGEQRIESPSQPEPREPTTSIRPVSRTVNERSSLSADPVGLQRGGSSGLLATAPVLPPEPVRSRNRFQAPPTVQITIGRIEVRAVTAQRRTPEPARKVSRPRPPAMSLDDYLSKRNGGRG